MYQVIPGVLEKSWEEIKQKLDKIQEFTNTVHVDIIDGRFVDNRTFLDPEPFKDYSGKLFLELHMMVENPSNLIHKWGKAGFKRFLGHIEHMPDQREFIAEAKKYGEVGLALDGPTHISEIKVSLDTLDCILIYTSNRVGFSGPPLVEDRLDKMKHLRKLTNVPIEADGGISGKTITRAKEAGAARFVSTSFIWNSENPISKFEELNHLLA